MSYRFRPGNMSRGCIAYKDKDTFVPVGKLSMPPTELCVCVGMNEVGYLTPEMPQKYILTFALGPCIGIYARNLRTGAQTLAHICGNLAGKARAFMRFSREKGLIETFPKEIKCENLIQILQSPYASDENVTEIRNALNGFGAHNIEVLRKQETYSGNNGSIENPFSIDVIYDSEGRMYELTEIRNPFGLDDPFKNALVNIRAFSPNLWVTNEDNLALEYPLKLFARDLSYRKNSENPDRPSIKSLPISFPNYIGGNKKC
jgi:hypothetical protein